MKLLTQKEVMEFVEGSMKFGMKPGLQRITALMETLGNPQEKIKSLHVAGTNGKGSVCSVLNQALVDKGYKVGLFISPYLEDFKERIQINNEMISMDDLVYYVSIVKEQIDILVSKGMEHPTEFEIITAVMFLYFYEKKVDYAVVEVGLGGDIDSTNVLKPIISVITSISFDHMGVLGNTIEEIARAKAGIIKDAPTVSIEQLKEAEDEVVKRAKETSSELTIVNKKDASFISFNENTMEQSIEYKTPSWNFIGETKLLGIHQLDNTLLAITALDVLNQKENLGLKIEDINKSLKNTVWPGRLETIKKDPLILLDGAHNTDGIEKLKSSLDFYLKGRPYTLILGILADKDTHGMAKIIAPEAQRVICVTPMSDRASLAEVLASYVHELNEDTSYNDSYEGAVKDALSTLKDNEYIIITGSLYMVGEYRKVLRKMFS